MSDHALPVLYALFLWWFGTGAILWLDRLPKRTFGRTLAGAGALAALALYGLAETRDDNDAAGAYVAFSSALAVWAWNEVGFLTGLVTGPERRPVPPGTAGWPRLRAAVLAIAWHELSLAASGAAVAAVTWGGSNRVGLWTFLLLWVMRLSAKLNLFLGVPNTGREFLPDHLNYMASHFRRRPMNPLFPVSVTAAAAVLPLLIAAAGSGDAGTAGEATGFTFLAALMALALLEHWMLVLPVPSAALWSWYLAPQDIPAEISAEIPTQRRQ